MMRRTPEILFTEVEEAYFISNFVPHWHAHVLGPPRYGEFEPIHIVIARIVLPTYDDAESAVWEHITSACRTWGREFDSDEWNIDLTLCNGN